MIKKIWFIFGEITRDDLEWVIRSTLEFKLGEQEFIDVAVFGTNKHSKIASKKHPAEIITSNEKEETWLKLYFADRLVLADKYFYEERFYN